MIPFPCRMRWAGSVRSGRPSGSMVIIVIAVIIAMMTFALGRFGMRGGRQGR